MIKFLMIGYICTVGYMKTEEKCMRIASEMIYFNEEKCLEYVDAYTYEFLDVNQGGKATVEFMCVPTYIIEDILEGVRA